MEILWSNIATDAVGILISAAIIALFIFIPYKLIKRLIKFGIEYYFQLKKLNKD